MPTVGPFVFFFVCVYVLFFYLPKITDNEFILFMVAGSSLK